MASDVQEEDSRIMESEAVMAIYENEKTLAFTFGPENSVSYRLELNDIDAVLVFHLSDKYPEVPPDIKVAKSSNHFIELEKLLMELAKSMLGEVMMYNLIEEAKKWAAENKLPKDLAANASPPTVCTFFLEGKCRFGDKCKNLHPNVDSTTSNKTGKQQSVNVTSNSSDVHTSNVNKDSNSSKKSSMKTACDVISRIQWDDKIDASNFCIGYLDRFVGIIEKPFTDFSWEDIASADYNVLSIPRHRIQYFKYNDKIVWDKRERLDNVFGSTGSGITIYDLITDNHTTTDKKGEVSSAEEAEFPSNFEADDIDIEHISTANKSSRKDNVPNYFLAFKVQDEEILSNIDELQKALVSREHGMADGLIQPQQFHITMLMLTIKNDKELNLVKDILKGIQHAMPSILPPSQNLTYRGAGSFKDRILYVSLDDDPRLQKWVQLLTSKLRSAGICLDGNRDKFVPHLTVVRLPSNSKISPATGRKVFLSIEMEYDGTVLGRQGVSSVGLYSRFEPKDVNGFHAEAFRVENSFFAVFPSLKDKVLKYLENTENIEVGLREEVRELLTSEAISHSADEALCMLCNKQQQQEQQQQQQHDRLVVIMRGIPGCGKTYLLENSIESNQRQGIVICSPKQLFYRAGNSPMDQADINIAEAYCRNGFLEALSSDASIIAIDDCHIQCWQYLIYQKMAAIFGVPVKILQVSCSDRESILKCHQYSNESMDALVNLVEDLEDDCSAVCIEPWFNNPSIQDGGISLRDLLN